VRIKGILLRIFVYVGLVGLFGLMTYMELTSESERPPLGVPADWRQHRGVFGDFELWLPEEWRGTGVVSTAVRGLREVVGGSETPLLFSALGRSMDGLHERIDVRDCNTLFESYPASLTGEDIAKSCAIRHRVVMRDSGEVVRLDASDVTTIELDEGSRIVAYQNRVLAQSADKDLVGTVACVVDRHHVYQVYMDTIEGSDSTNIATYEGILRTLREYRYQSPDLSHRRAPGPSLSRLLRDKAGTLVLILTTLVSGIVSAIPTIAIVRWLKPQGTTWDWVRDKPMRVIAYGIAGMFITRFVFMYKWPTVFHLVLWTVILPLGLYGAEQRIRRRGHWKS
jgi:hypothetical protein